MKIVKIDKSILAAKMQEFLEPLTPNPSDILEQDSNATWQYFYRSKAAIDLKRLLVP